MNLLWIVPGLLFFAGLYALVEKMVWRRQGRRSENQYVLTLIRVRMDKARRTDGVVDVADVEQIEVLQKENTYLWKVISMLTLLRWTVEIIALGFAYLFMDYFWPGFLPLPR
ncbi:MAG: hypothetical protein HOO67_07375 [Candidatus Peribacteraceae bacterium]|nr:hypothetical protein [Candidatus Peribacteraceae bacterium]